jgi:hypothetical protein
MKYLHAQDIEGKSFDIIETHGVFPLMISDNVVESGYTHISSIENWNYVALDIEGDMRSRELIGRDYKFVRDQIKELVCLSGESTTISEEADPASIFPIPTTGDSYLIASDPVGDFTGNTGMVAIYDGASWSFKTCMEIGFNLLSTGDTLICAKHKVGSHAQIYGVFGDIDTQVNEMELYHERVTYCRKKRLNYVISRVHNHLEHLNFAGYTVPEIILSEIIPYNLIYLYEDLGLGGIVDGDNSAGLIDYVNCTANTPFNVVEGGIRNKSWIPEALNNMGELADIMMDIFLNGNY